MKLVQGEPVLKKYKPTDDIVSVLLYNHGTDFHQNVLEWAENGNISALMTLLFCWFRDGMHVSFWKNTSLSYKYTLIYRYGRCLHPTSPPVFASGLPRCAHNFAVSVYTNTRIRVAEAYVCWVLCGKRLGLYKDLINYIAVFFIKHNNEPLLWDVFE